MSQSKPNENPKPDTERRKALSAWEDNYNAWLHDPKNKNWRDAQ